MLMIISIMDLKRPENLKAAVVIVVNYIVNCTPVQYYVQCAEICQKSGMRVARRGVERCILFLCWCCCCC